MSKAMLEAYLDALWNKKQLEVIPLFVHNTVVIHAALGTFYGSKAMQYIASTWLNGFPDLQVTPENSIIEKDLVMIHFKATGTHKGEIFQIPASNNTVNFTGACMYRLNNSLVTEYWMYIDTHHIRLQLLAK